MARVYVGTYGKYNAGSIAGTWIDLGRCNNYADFLNKCKETHKNERDPEFMIQDAEDMPDGLSCMEWITEQEFNDIKAALPAVQIIDYSERAIAVVGDTKPMASALKSLGGKFNFRLSCGAGWIFPKTKADAVRELIGGGLPEPNANASDKKKSVFAEFLDNLELPSDKQYHKKYSANAVKLPEGYYLIEKPTIDNRFCFHDEGPDYDFYCSLHENESNLRSYFMSENLRKIDDRIEALTDTDEYTVLVGKSYRKGIATLNYFRYPYEARRAMESQGMRSLTEAERSEIVEAMKVVRADFEKRLNTYLNRYGVSKIHTWTYWADR